MTPGTPRRFRFQRPLVAVALLLAVTAGGSVLDSQPAQSMSFREGISVSNYPFQPDDWTATGQRADVVVIGVIEQVGPARWTTPDGQPASLVQLQSNPAVQVRTPAQVVIERTFKGDPSASVITFSFLGGYVGDVTVLTDELETITEGRRVLLFLEHAPAGSPVHVVDSGLYPAAWLTVTGDTAVGPLYDVPLATVVEQLESLEGA